MIVGNNKMGAVDRGHLFHAAVGQTRDRLAKVSEGQV
jgi:hypothetical protein